MTADFRNKEKNRDSLPIAQGPVPFQLLIRICAVFVALTGGIALLGWMLGAPFLSSLDSGNIPVAPSTAILFVLYAVALYLRSLPPQRGAYWAGLAITSAGATVALLLFILSYQGIHLEAEHLGITIIHPAGEMRIGHISPVTAFCFLLASLSFLASSANRPRLTPVAGLLAALLAGSGFVFALAYMYGAPLLYGSSYIPPAALTSMAFLFLGGALLALALPPAWLARLQAESPPRALYTFILIFFFLAAAIVIAGFITYRNHEQGHRIEVGHQLSAIAELKINELMLYRQERIEDARLLSESTSFAALVRRFLEKPEDTKNERLLQEWLTKLRAHAQYDQVRLLDTNGTIRLSAPAEAKPLSAIISQRLPEILKSGQVATQDFYRNDHNGKIYLAVLAPILDPQNGNRPLGLLSLRIDPEQYLYPFIQRWPIPSRTAETLLVRREGAEVVFLNELRFQKNTALTLHFPLTQTDLPAVRAALGQNGIANGHDYRGVPVIADVHPIPDSPWFLVSKMSISEAYAPLREHLWLMGGFVVVLLFGVGAIMAFIWQRQRMIFFQERIETAAALKNLNRIYAVLSNINQTIVRIHDPQELFQATCRIAVEDGGFLLAGICLLDKASGAVKQAASAGKDDGYLARLCITLGNAPSDQGPTGSALREGRYSVANDIEHDDCMAPWRDDALQRGYRSSAAFPLIVFGEVRGAINFYADEPHFFNTNEIRLLDELARDISFSLEFSEQEETRRNAETALRESQQLFATVANTSPALIWMSGLDKGCIWFNEPWLAFTGRALAEELGDGWAAGVHADDLTHCLHIYTEAFEARQPFAMEYRLRRHDGEYRWILDQGQPRYDASGAFMGYIGTCLDISEHRNLENQMRHAVKMESIGTLAGGVAHDFNNILMAIIGYGQLTLMGMAPDDPQRLNIVHMLEGADRAARLTKDLLLFSRKQISERKPVDLIGIIKTVEKFIVRVIGEDIACETRLPDEPLTVLADSHQIEQVLMNFATNARDAMSKGGIFSITAEQTVLHHDFIAAHGFGRPGPYALLTIADNGCGMDEQTRTRIFEPFFTTKGVGKGTGLGLAVVYGIIKQHEGYINVYSEPDNGATFRLYLPLIVADTPTEKIAEKEEAPAHGRETILVAEDDESLRALAKTALTRFGYTVIEAVDGEEAVRKFAENQSSIQLLLFDIIMPKMNGQEAYEAISKIRPGIKTIFMSGYAPDTIREKAGLGDTVPLLAKPLSPTELLQKVRKILDQ
ncbi:MAG: GAF domain-containing protein [Deltaproteobacteria bacterium]|nr:GAF domain-containing protein [Deltaproteobacteria bacterium]